jgi:hypothetical protein
VVLECDCGSPNFCHPEIATANGQPFCVGVCPNPLDVCTEFKTDTDGDGVADRFACDCVRPPPPDPHRTVQGTSVTFGTNDVPAIPGGFFDPGSDPFTGIVNMQAGPMDTLIQRSGPIVCIGPLPAPCDVVQTEIVALDLVSVSPITVSPGGTQWDVAVGLSVNAQSLGTLSATKTHANGGTFSASIMVRPRITFTEVGNPGNVKTIDYGPAGIPSLEVNFVGAHWVVNLGLGLAGTIAAPNNGNFVPGVQEQNPPDPNSQVVVQATGNSKGGGVSHPVRPQPLCLLPFGANDPCAPFQARDCQQTAAGQVCLPTVVQAIPGTNPQVLECGCRTTNECHLAFDAAGLTCINACPDLTLVCTLVGTDTDGDSVDDQFRCDCVRPPAACCLPDGTCAVMPEADCLARRGKVLPAGAVCLGDNNGDGIDDACGIGPCGECPKGIHWIDQTLCPPGYRATPGVCKIGGGTCTTNAQCPGFCSVCTAVTCTADTPCPSNCGTCEQDVCNKPGGDQDTVHSGAVLGIDTTGDCIADLNAVLGGTATIHKEGPYDDSNNYPGTRPVDGHKDVVDTEIIAMSLTGGLPVVTMTAGAGLGTNPLPATLGAVAEQPGDPSSADSFFDVFVELTDGGGNKHYNQAPIRVQTVVNCLPPKANYIHITGCLPLFSSPVPGQGTRTANLVRANHFTFPDCCYNDKGGVCIDNVPVDACKAGGGKPVPTCLGDDPFDTDTADEACEKATPDDCKPDPDPASNGRRCLPVACPNTTEICVPQVIGTIPGASGLVVLECDCQDPNRCHPEFDAAGGATCVGGCPNATDVCRRITQDTDGDGVIDRYTCNCEPQPVDCRPLPDHSGCTPICNLAGEVCVPTVIGLIPGTTQLGVVACDCLPDDRCHIEPNPAPLGSTCTGICPPGQDCKRTGTDSNNDGVDDTFRCDCIDVDCVPNATGSACEPALCLGPAIERCNAKCARWNPATGVMVVTACDCTGTADCHLERGPIGAAQGEVAGTGNPCVVPDTGGTVNLPPENCGYVSPTDLHEIIAGLPPGTTIQIGAQHERFFNINRTPGGTLNGEVETFSSSLMLNMMGTGDLDGMMLTKKLIVQCETHTGPRGTNVAGAGVQSFATDMMMLQGQLGIGDPDFDLLRIRGGTGFGMPSPGHTTLTMLPGNQWAVDSFFDITYRIDFVGAAGGPLQHMSGSTTATIRMATGTPTPPVCVGGCPAGQVCRETRTVHADTTITICCDCVSTCPKPSTPVLHPIRKNRFLSFRAGDAGRSQTIRVRFVNLPPPFHIWNGAQLYVENPVDVCEIAGVPPGGTCPPGAPTFKAAKLVCTPQCKTDWAAQGMIHVYQEGIIPGAVYEIDVLDCNCDPTDPNAKSNPVSVSTSKYGDIAGPFSGGSYPGPDGTVDVTVDVLADLAKFANRAGAPEKARADLEPNCVDLQNNISDVTETLNGFRSLPYRFRPKAPDPCQSPCP